jgi:hypothetical protein
MRGETQVVQTELIEQELTSTTAIETLKKEVRGLFDRGRQVYGLKIEQVADRMRVDRATVFRMLQPGKKVPYPLLITLAYTVQLHPSKFADLVRAYNAAYPDTVPEPIALHTPTCHVTTEPLRKG